MTTENRGNAHHVIDAELFYSPEAQTTVVNYQATFKKMLEDQDVSEEQLEQRSHEGTRPIVRITDSNTLFGSLMPPIVEHAVVSRMGRPFHEPITIHFSQTGVDFLTTKDGKTTGVHFDLLDEARFIPRFVDGLTTTLQNAIQKKDAAVFFEYKPRVTQITGPTQPNKAA